MRLHLVISRHGLPVTRILWTTSTAFAGEYGAHNPASSAAVASARAPNAAFSNGGYTVAQLLEDVNEVVPLETEPHVLDEELSGQWGLEDYVVEVAGSECLHFMEVDGLLRDGDEVLIRALQLADLRTRRLCGRHQITSEGKHLIDGVPFGSPFLKRSTTTRPAIPIPPRKRRRTVFSGWEPRPDIPVEDALQEPADDDRDGEWMPPREAGFGKELSLMPPEHEESMGTVIRYPIDHSADSESEGDVSDIEEDEGELESELQALKEDFEEPSQFVDIRNQTRHASGHASRVTSVSKRPTSKGSLVGASSLSSKRSREDDSSPKTSKAVRFNKGNESVDKRPQAKESAAEASSSDSESASSDSDSDSDSDGASSEVEPAQEANSQESESDSSSDSSDSSDSESEDEESPAPKPQPPHVMSAPGEGSIRTRKSNNRFKMRRRLSKLKELGALPDEADFNALRAWENINGGWSHPEQSVISEAPAERQPEQSSEKSAKQIRKENREQEQKEFEAKRQKLLRDLASGNGVDVDQTSEKENVPPRKSGAEAPVSEQVPDEDQPDRESSKEAAQRRTLDLASSRRMLFGSLGMRTPKTKEEEEQTRQKMAAKASANTHQKRPSEVAQDEVDRMDEDEDVSDDDWGNKLTICAVECIYPEIELTAPPFPFVQRWDKKANALIREQKGPSKKRKRKQRIQVYDNEEEYDENAEWYGDDYYQEDHQGYDQAAADSFYQGHYAGEADGDGQLNYDEGPEPEPNANSNEVSDLPCLPSDMDSVPDLDEKEVKVGAIIAFRQLDMSKATNWQPQMSEYRVAEVRSIEEQGVINVLLAKRDRRQRTAGADDEVRRFSKFEVPDLANDEEEDGGYRELAFSELSDPKLLQAAASIEGQHSEGSIVSVVEESVPNAQTPPEMDLDETTFVTIGNEVSHLGSPREWPVDPDEAQQTPGTGDLPRIQVQVGSGQRSVTPPIPSPSFSGFHSAQSGQTPGLYSNLEGHTLVGGETPSAAMNREEGPSMLSYTSANQSFEYTPEEAQTPDQQERQVVENLAPPGDSAESGSGPQSGSLLSTIRSSDAVPSSQHAKGQSIKKDKSSGALPSSGESWADMLARLKRGPSATDQILNETDSDLDSSEDSSDSEDGEEPGTPGPSSRHSSPQNSSTGSDNDPSNPTDPTHLLNFFSPAASTRSQASRVRDSIIPQIPESQLPLNSQVPASQTSQVIDLTSSPHGSPEPGSQTTPPRRTRSKRLEKKSESPRAELPRASTGQLQQPTVEIPVSPALSRKRRRTTRKF